MAKPRIAHLAGPNATIQNTPPLVTSNKARRLHGLPLLTDADGAPVRFDALRTQRLAAPATVYVEQFSAHPLERDAAGLYGPPDGYVDAAGDFHEQRRNPGDKPVYRVELRPEDGLYPLPYMARQADGSAWEDDTTHPGAPAAESRQAYFPDGSRLFEEVDRLGVSMDRPWQHDLPPSPTSTSTASCRRAVTPGGCRRRSGRISAKATFRPRSWVATSSPTARPISPRRARPALARIANETQRILATGEYIGAIWSQGSPRIEETVYWLQLLLDTALRSAATRRSAPWARSRTTDPRTCTTRCSISPPMCGPTRTGATGPAWC